MAMTTTITTTRMAAAIRDRLTQRGTQPPRCDLPSRGQCFGAQAHSLDLFSIHTVAYATYCRASGALYGVVMPTLWTETVETHRQEVREAIVAATGALVLDHGLLAVTMSQIAESTGIGRATLYKYFPDVEAILAAWHERHVTAHLSELAALSRGNGTATDRFRSVLMAYARICRQRRQHGEGELAAALHRTEPVIRLQRDLLGLVANLVSETVAEGRIRDDIPAQELAGYCINALEAAGDLSSTAAMTRLVELIWAGMAAPAVGGSR